MAKVLVIDDDNDLRESVSDWLRREHEVCQAASIPDGVALLARVRPDVIVCDLDLPPHRGDEFLAMVAERHPDIGRFMLTGTPGRALGRAYGICHRVFKKGCDLMDLTRAIREFLAHREPRHA